MTPETPPSSRPDPDARVLLGALVATFAVIAGAAMIPPAREWRLWGINHLAFYATPVRLAALVLIAAAFVPSITRPVYDGLRRIPDALGGGGSRSGVVILLLSIASVFLFYELRAATNLLGDGQLIVQSFQAAAKGNQKVVMRSVHAILTTEFIAPGTTLLYYWVVQVATTSFKQEVAHALVFLPCVLGGVFVYVVLRLVRDLSARPAVRAWLLVLALFASSIQLFFGYIENYSAIFVSLALYVIAGFLALHRRVGWWVPVALLVVSIYLHVQSLVFLPSLVYVLVWRGTLKRGRALRRYALPGIALLSVAGAIAGRSVKILGKFYLPFEANADSYGVVSPGHLGDMANEIVLLLPIVLFVIAVWHAGKAARGEGASPSKGDGEWVTRPREWRFVALILLACFLYMTLFKPEIGMARDWDLFTMTSLGLVPLVLLAVNRWLRYARPSTATVASVTVPALVMTAVLTAAWVGINASPDRTTDRYEAVLAYDQTHVGYAYENLAKFYHERGELAKAVRVMEVGAKISGNPRLYAKLAAYYQDNGDIASGIRILKDVLEKHPEHSKARQKLLDLLEKAHDWQTLTDVAREGVKIHPRESIFSFALGVGLVRMGRVDEALDAFRTCLTLNPPDSQKQFMLRAFKEAGQKP